MKPHLAALLAGPFAGPGWLLGGFLGGIAHWVVALLGGLVGLAWLAGPVEALVVLATPAVVAAGVYVFVVHGEDRPLFAGLGGVALGALAGSAALLLGLLGLLPAVAALLLGGAVLGAVAALAMAPRRPAPSAA